MRDCAGAGLEADFAELCDDEAWPLVCVEVAVESAWRCLNEDDIVAIRLMRESMLAVRDSVRDRCEQCDCWQAEFDRIESEKRFDLASHIGALRFALTRFTFHALARSASESMLLLQCDDANQRIDCNCCAQTLATAVAECAIRCASGLILSVSLLLFQSASAARTRLTQAHTVSHSTTACTTLHSITHSTKAKAQQQRQQVGTTKSKILVASILFTGAPGHV